MRALGVDVGERRVGVAVSDATGTIASPRDTVEGNEDPGVVADRLAVVAAEEGVEVVVVGLPLGLAGHDTRSTERAREVADALRARDLAVELCDERLTSAQAERTLLEAGRSRKRRRHERDRVAATLILQGWLDARPAARPEDPVDPEDADAP